MRYTPGVSLDDKTARELGRILGEALVQEYERGGRMTETRAFHRVEIVSHDDGSATAHCHTNDNNDDGYPDGETAEWSIEHASVERALKQHGKCRVGISGIVVTVTLDGERVE